ncbi:MAG: hypothetical protein ABSA83_03995 [Verrucomicrobiota bacterium]
MKFSWLALVLAPLPIPFLYSVLLEASAPGKSPILAILFFTAVGCVVCYGATIFLLLPALFVISRFRPLTGLVTGLTGTVLGVAVNFPIAWQCYLASGNDSGPPEGTYWEYLRHNCFGVDLWACLVAGLATAMLYWFLATRASEILKMIRERIVCNLLSIFK